MGADYFPIFVICVPFDLLMVLVNVTNYRADFTNGYIKKTGTEKAEIRLGVDKHDFWGRFGPGEMGG